MKIRLNRRSLYNNYFSICKHLPIVISKFEPNSVNSPTHCEMFSTILSQWARKAVLESSEPNLKFYGRVAPRIGKHCSYIFRPFCWDPSGISRLSAISESKTAHLCYNLFNPLQSNVK
jgi:hypothetical protein